MIRIRVATDVVIHVAAVVVGASIRDLGHNTFALTEMLR